LLKIFTFWTHLRLEMQKNFHDTIMKDFRIKYPNDDTPAAESGKADDLRTDDKDGRTFWGKVAKMKDLNHRAAVVREDASKERSKTKNDRGRTEEVLQMGATTYAKENEEMKAKRQKVQVDQDEDSVEDDACDGSTPHHGKEENRLHRGPGRKQGGTGGSGDRGAIVVQEAIGEVGAKMEAKHQRMEAVEREKMQREQEQLDRRLAMEEEQLEERKKERELQERKLESEERLRHEELQVRREENQRQTEITKMMIQQLGSNAGQHTNDNV